MNQPLALVIDDEPDICELLTLTLGRMDIRTESAADVKSAKTLLGKHKFDLCLTDMRLPDGDGLELVEWMQINASGVPVAVITAHGNVETAVQALKLGAFDFISKPLDLGQPQKHHRKSAAREGARTWGRLGFTWRVAANAGIARNDRQGFTLTGACAHIR